MKKIKRVIKGYKAFDKDLKCRDTQFVVGETYKVRGPLKICENGLHFCTNAFDVYNHYPRQGETRVCEVEALGAVTTEGDKSCTLQLRILRELTAEEKLNLWINRTNSGYYNSGNYNSGNSNSGYYNSGDYNSGDYNSGNSNSGNSNSGNYNSGNSNSGYLNSNTPTVRLFNKDSGLTFDSKEIQRLSSLNVRPILEWVYSEKMTKKEKDKNPSHTTIGGFLRKTGRMSWDAVSAEDLQFIQALPNFDAAIFKEITGIDVNAKRKAKRGRK